MTTSGDIHIIATPFSRFQDSSLNWRACGGLAGRVRVQTDCKHISVAARGNRCNVRLRWRKLFCPLRVWVSPGKAAEPDFWAHRQLHRHAVVGMLEAWHGCDVCVWGRCEVVHAIRLCSCAAFAGRIPDALLCSGLAGVCDARFWGVVECWAKIAFCKQHREEMANRLGTRSLASHKASS